MIFAIAVGLYYMLTFVLIDQLLKLISKNKIGFSYKKNNLPLKLFFKKEIFSNFYNLILTLYLYLIVFPKIGRIENALSNYNFKKYSLLHFF